MLMLKTCCNRIYGCKVILSTLALSVLFVSVIVRMIVTINPGFDINFSMPTLILPEILPKYGHWEPVTPSQVCCLCIWFSMTYLSCSLIYEITRFTGFFRIIFAAFHDLRQNIALLSLHSYEIWMFAFIYKTYVTEFDYIFQIVIILPLITLLLLTIFQMTWTQDDVKADDKGRLQELQYYAVTSLLYSATMVFHVVCMGVTNYIRTKDVALDDGDLTNMHIFLLGVAEILYRLHSIKKNYSLIYMHRNPPMPRGERAEHDGRDGQPVVQKMRAPVARADRKPADNKPDEFTYLDAIMMVGLTIFDAVVIGRFLL